MEKDIIEEIIELRKALPRFFMECEASPLAAACAMTGVIEGIVQTGKVEASLLEAYRNIEAASIAQIIRETKDED